MDHLSNLAIEILLGFKLVGKVMGFKSRQAFEFRLNRSGLRSQALPYIPKTQEQNFRVRSIEFAGRCWDSCFEAVGRGAWDLTLRF